MSNNISSRNYLPDQEEHLLEVPSAVIRGEVWLIDFSALDAEGLPYKVVASAAEQRSCVAVVAMEAQATTGARCRFKSKGPVMALIETGTTVTHVLYVNATKTLQSATVSVPTAANVVQVVGRPLVANSSGSDALRSIMLYGEGCGVAHNVAS